MHQRNNVWWSILGVLLAGAIGVRLYHITWPLADWHSWRQSDTAAVARNFLKFGFDPLRPRYDDLSNIQSGKDNPMGWRMVEFPIYQLAATSLKQAVGRLPIEVWLRIVSITATAGSMIILALLVSSLLSPITGLVTAFIFGFLPYSVYYGRTILPEPTAVFFALLSLWALVGKKSWGAVCISGIAGAIALLVKPTSGFLLIPIPYLLVRDTRISFRFIVSLVVYTALVGFPIALWRWWISRFPEGIPVFEWLLNAGNIRFKGAWFYWLFARRVSELILGYWGVVFLAYGSLLKSGKKEGWVFHWLGLGSLLYLVVFAAGNVQHDYYQIILLPALSIYLGKGIVGIAESQAFGRLIRYVMVFSLLAFTFAFSWYTIRTYYWINRPEIVEAGKKADSILPKDAKVIAPYNGDTTFLYQTNRQGWPLGFDIDKKIAMGATAYVTVSPTDADFETMTLAKTYTVLVRNDKYAIIDLTKPVNAHKE